MNKIEVATALFEKGFNCTQALLAAYSADFGLKRKTALKIGSAFGGGMGRRGEICGFVTGAFMIIGLKYGMTDASDKKAKMKTYELVNKFVNKFKSRNGSVVCKELLGFDISSVKELKRDLKKVIMGQCPKYIQDSTEILEEIILV